MTALFVFDLDGTLLPGSTASLELAGALGAVDDLHALETRFAAGTLDTRGFAAAVHDPNLEAPQRFTGEVLRLLELL